MSGLFFYVPDLARQPLMPGNMTNRPLSLPYLWVSTRSHPCVHLVLLIPLNTLHHSAMLRSSAK